MEIRKLFLVLLFKNIGTLVALEPIVRPLRLTNNDGRCLLNSVWQSFMASLPAVADLLPRDESALEDYLASEKFNSCLNDASRADTQQEGYLHDVRMLFHEIQRYQLHATDASKNLDLYSLSDEIVEWYDKEWQFHLIPRLGTLLNLLCGDVVAERFDITHDDRSLLIVPHDRLPRIVVLFCYPSEQQVSRMGFDRVIYLEKALRKTKHEYTLAGVVNSDHNLLLPELNPIFHKLGALLPNAIISCFKRIFTQHADGYVRYGDKIFYVNDSTLVEPQSINLDNVGLSNVPSSNRYEVEDAINKLLPGQPLYGVYVINSTATHVDKDHEDNNQPKGLILPADLFKHKLAVRNIWKRPGEAINSLCIPALALLIPLHAYVFSCYSTELINNLLYANAKPRNSIGLLPKTIFYGASLMLQIRALQGEFCYSRIFLPTKTHPLSQLSSGYPAELVLYARSVFHKIKNSLKGKRSKLEAAEEHGKPIDPFEQFFLAYL